MTPFEFGTPAPLLSPELGPATGSARQSLSSVVKHICEKNQLTVNDVFSNLILPRLGTSSDRTTKMGFEVHLINRGCSTTDRLLGCLQDLVPLPDLSCFTLRELTSLRGVGALALAHERRWCPECFSADVRNGVNPYDRLLWSIKAVEVCPVHSVHFASVCQSCGKGPFRVLSGRDLSGHCPNCFAWLGRWAANLEESRDGHSLFIYWAAKSFADLLESPPPRDLDVWPHVRRVLLALAQKHFGGSYAALASSIERNKSVIGTWLSGLGAPSWSALIEISFAFQVPLTELLSGQLDAVEISSLRCLPTYAIRRMTHPRKKPHRRSLEEIRAFLGRVEDGDLGHLLSLECIGKRLNIDVRELRRILPAETMALAEVLGARRKQRTERNREERVRRLQDEIPTVLSSLQTKGLKPTRRAVEAELANAGIRLEEVYKRFHAEIRVTGDLKSFGYLHRTLRWFETEVWDHRLAKPRKSPHSRKSPRHGGGPFNNVIEFAHKSSHPLEVGSALIARTFYADNGDHSEPLGEDADADPIQDSGRTCESIELATQKATAFNAVDRIALSRRKARYAAQAIEMGNQNLPITHATLTGFELKMLLQALTDINQPAWSDVPQNIRQAVAAWGACRLFTGRGTDSLSKMHIHRDGVSANSSMLWDPTKGTLWLPCESPRHKAPEDLSRVLAPSPGFTLNVADTLAPYLRKVASKTQRVFMRHMDDEFSQLLGRINRAYGTALTLNRVSNCIPGLIAQMAPNDEVMSVYFSGRAPNQHNPCVYSSVPAMRLASLFDRACERVYELAEKQQTFADTSSFPNLISENDEVVGSMHVPKLETLRDTVADTLARLEKNKNSPGTPIHELHNAYTAYVLLFVLATTAIRAVRKPIPAEFNIDRATGSCFISEKDTDNYSNARVVWLHPILIEQLDEYARHVTRLRQHLALVNLRGVGNLDARKTIPLLSPFDKPNRSNDQSRLQGGTPVLFMLSDYAGHLNDILPNQVEDLLGDHWRLRLVSLRHFVRTQLLQSGCSGTLINALLGHADRGESPWNNFSCLPPAVWRRHVAGHLSPILSQLGFKVVASPLLRS